MVRTKLSQLVGSFVKLTNEGIKVHASTLLFGGCSLMEALLFINVFWSCQDTFDCMTFWPTISYVGCFRGHDRLFNLALAYFAVWLCLFIPCVLACVAEHSGRCTKWFLGVGGLLLSVTLPWASIIDEANSSHIAPLEKIHVGIVTGIVIGGLIWSIVAVKAASRTKGKDDQVSFLKSYWLFSVVMLAFAVYEWKYAYSDQANWWVNENVEALCEWTIVTLAVFFPYVFSLVGLDFWIDLKTTV